MEEYQPYEPLQHNFLHHPIELQYEYHPPAAPLDRTSSSSSSSQLHSVRKNPSKPWRTTTKTAVSHHVPGAGDSRPSASPPKVYRVDPRGFRQLVQRLTGAATSANHQPAPQQRRLRDAAPAPLQLFQHAPVAVQQNQQLQVLLTAPPQHTAQQHHHKYPAPYTSEAVLQPQLKAPEVVGAADDHHYVPTATYDSLPQQQKAPPLPCPAAAKMTTTCQSPGDWTTLLSPSIISAWCSLPLPSPLLSPGSMTPIEASTVN